MDYLQCQQLVVVLLDGAAEIQAGIAAIITQNSQTQQLAVNNNSLYIPFVDYFAILPLEKRAHLGLARQYRCDQLTCYLLFGLVRIGHIPFLQPQFALTAEQQHEKHL